MVDRLLLITLGATIRDALLVVLFANILSSAVIILNGRAAATYHMGYPVLSRVSFGIYGQYFVVVLRALLSIIWGFAYPFLIKEFNLLIYLSVVQGEGGGGGGGGGGRTAILRGPIYLHLPPLHLFRLE